MYFSKDYKPNWLEQLALNIVKMGPIPKHIALILDGNRRYARKQNLGGPLEGHKLGADKLDEVCQMLIAFGVEEVTTYIFSVENFKRAQDEIDGLMDLLAEKSAYSDERYAVCQKRGVRIEVLGNLDLAPANGIRTSLKRNMILSKDHKTLKVNLAFIYTGRNEITTGVNDFLQGVQQGHVDLKDASPELLQELFTLSPSRPVDLLVRTSGECRLSDFLLWGCSNAYVEFVGETWPEYSFWGLLGAVFRYQNQLMYKGMMTTMPMEEASRLGTRPKEYVRRVREDRFAQIFESVKDYMPESCRA